ncbi:MAG: hypothetical protein ABIO46_15835 [Chitinophagales bacterium]
MEDLSAYYNSLFDESVKAFLAGDYFIDAQINSLSDNRFGLTLIIKIDDSIKIKIQSFIDDLKNIDPHQYYYSQSDLHVTVMSIISCYDGFSLENISVTDYIKVIEKSMTDINAIEIDFHGVTASSSAILIQGFLAEDALNNLRNNLRMNFKSSGLEQSIDKRYSIFAAHITVARFRQKIKDPPKLIHMIEENRRRDFGKMKVEQLDLVYNDWYHREDFVKQLYSLSLK